MRIVSLVFVLALVGCAPGTGTARPDPAGTPDPAATRSAPGAPMTVEWLYRGETAGRLTLVARVNRVAPIRIPITVTVSVPPGVRLVSGRSSWIVDGSGATGPVDETLVLEVTRSGPQEVLLAADAETAHFGVHARKSYALGPTQPKALSAPMGSGPALQVGGHDFGPSVPSP